jgi:AraC-like DNA-binding protein
MLAAHAPSVLTSWTCSILRALEARSIDVAPLLRDAEVSPEALRDPNGRVPLATSNTLWRLAVERAGDPAFGLYVSKHVTQTTFHGLGVAMLASATLRDALQRLVRYNHVVTDATDLRLDVSGDRGRLTLLIADDAAPPLPRAGQRPAKERKTAAMREPGAPPAEAIDAAMSLMVRVCRFLTGHTFTLVEVDQTRPAPSDSEPYTRFFGCPVRFGAAFDALTFDARGLDRPREMSNPELARYNDDAVQAYLERVRSGNVVDQVRARLATRLADRPTAEDVASALGLSQRSLQRRLKERGTSYEAILALVRRDLACAYLRDERYTITELAFMLGFEDASSFARAFRRWTGASPSGFRSAVDEAERKAEAPGEPLLADR